MTRKNFIKACSLLGIGLYASGQNLPAHDKSAGVEGKKVIIIGAGAAGLTAGYLLDRAGIDYEILEASQDYGGRMKTNHTFTDFPLPMGAEWLSTTNIDLSTIADTATVLKTISTKSYPPDETYWLWDGSRAVQSTLNDFLDRKFVGSTWLGFFEKLVLPNIKEQITYRSPITAIDYSSNRVAVISQDKRYMADHVILTVPCSILQARHIAFTPRLPRWKQQAIDKATYWPGFKAFFEFGEHFYPAFVDYVVEPETAGHMSLYDAAYGQDSDHHIMGLFAVGEAAVHFSGHGPKELHDKIIAELDLIFDGQASKHYKQHIVQDWSSSPYALGAYISDYESSDRIYDLQQPVSQKLYFAGDGYTNGYDWGNVHNAITSAKDSVDLILSQ